MFEIKYEIFEDDVHELRTIDLETFIKEYDQIYGCFTLIINGLEYIPYPSPEMRLETKRIYSELILTHFDFLIDVYDQLQRSNYSVLKYIENSWTWLEFIKDENKLTISKLNFETDGHLPTLILTDRSLFNKAIRVDIINEVMKWEDFNKELLMKSRELVNTIIELNKNIITAKCFIKIRAFSGV